MTDGSKKDIDSKCLLKGCKEMNEADQLSNERGYFASSWVGVCRKVAVANRLVGMGGNLSQGEINTYRHLISQANEEQKTVLFEQFGGNVPFLFQ